VWSRKLWSSTSIVDGCLPSDRSSGVQIRHRRPLKELFLSPSDRVLTTTPSLRCGKKRASTPESLLRSWVHTRFRGRSQDRRMAFPTEVITFHHSQTRCGDADTRYPGPQDRTPRSLDVSYYSVTQAKKAPSGVYRFDSDVNLANKTTTCGEAFTEFANDKGTLRESGKWKFHD